MTTPYPLCVCGHKAADHQDGAGPCHEPTGRCGCTLYAELCATCHHAKTDHNGTNNLCTRVRQATREACGCNQYVTPPAEPTTAAT
jgi:hypothetical protein